ncbi:hypothetical protein ACS0TY_026810 [Phlomoides rotata]
MSERYLREEFKKPEVSDIIIFKAPSFLQEFWFQWIDIPRISGMFGMFLVWNFCFTFSFFHGSSHTHRYIYIY